ncbi:MAG: GNAT family N-acetyltransferase [Candidatus Hodarchaeota archaeon]
MKIKEVTTKDLKEIHKLELKVFKEDAFSIDLIKKLIRRHTIFFKIIKTGKIAGFVIILKDRKDRANIINLLINPKYQNKGYGSKLLKHTIEKIKKEDKNVKKIALNVKTNNSLAIKLYEKFNFKKIQKIENYYRSKESSYLMEKIIEEKNN